MTLNEVQLYILSRKQSVIKVNKISLTNLLESIYYTCNDIVSKYKYSNKLEGLEVHYVILTSLCY